MPDDEPAPIAPYTGRTSSPETPADIAAAPPEPRVRWGRMVAVHLGAAFLAGLAVPVVASQGDPQWILIGLVSGIFVALIGGGLPLTGAALAIVIARRAGRGAMREIAAVMIGAVVGAVPIGLLVGAFLGIYGLVLAVVIGIASAVGFAIWVLVAWWPHLQTRPVR